jgi:hypothetical protein
VEHIVVSGLPIVLGDTVEVGDGVAERLCELALSGGGEESVLDGLVVPEEVDLNEALNERGKKAMVSYWR